VKGGGFSLFALSGDFAARSARMIRNTPSGCEKKSEGDAEFDAAHGTVTGGVQEVFGLTVAGDNARHAISHIASDTREFAAMMADLHVDHRDYTFIDLGSGKGRAVIMAAAYPFRRVIGVEFVKEFVDAAKANVAAAMAAKPTASPIEFVHSDAVTYEFPREPLIVYMFNPFDATIIRAVGERLIASWRAAPRPILVVYVNPRCLKDLTDVGWSPEGGHVANTTFLKPSGGA
jgi:SAM-dependent methyltransferase